MFKGKLLNKKSNTTVAANGKKPVLAQKIEPKGIKYTFEYYAPDAKCVELGSTFNDWNPSSTPLKKNGNGKWKITVTLPSGRYEYRFLVDGQWQNDQNPVECAPNAFGTWNCVFEVRE